MNKQEVQMMAFQIISIVGSAKSSFIEAMDYAKKKDFKLAKQSVLEGSELKNEAHKVHFELIQAEARGEDIIFSLILMHAEDQLLTTDVYHSMAEEIIELREELHLN